MAGSGRQEPADFIGDWTGSRHRTILAAQTALHKLVAQVTCVIMLLRGVLRRDSKGGD